MNPILVTTYYRSPDSEVKLLDDFKESHELLIKRDMNYYCLKPNNNNTKHIKRMHNTYGYTQMIGEPNRTANHSKTLIDYVATNRPDRVSDQRVLSCGIPHPDVFT